MDGHFVPSLTFGPGVVRAIRRWTSIPLDVHMMVEAPERYVDEIADAGADIITVHAEACTHLHRVVEQIKERGARAGVAVNPATPASAVEEVLPDLDQVLAMTVNPGFGGQPFIETMVDKIARLRKTLDERALDAELEVDGGIKAGNARLAAAGGRQRARRRLRRLRRREPRSPTPSRPSAPRPSAAPDIGGLRWHPKSQAQRVGDSTYLMARWWLSAAAIIS